MPGLVPGIHALPRFNKEEKDVDGRDKPGHDKLSIAALHSRLAYSSPTQYG